jgi:hypothetical protein
MTNWVRCPGPSPLTRPAAVVADSLSSRGVRLVHVESGRARAEYLEACLSAAAGKRVLIFCPDDDSAHALRQRLAAERARRSRAAERDRDLVAKAACERTVADADRELAALRAAIPAPVGLLGRLLGRGKPSAVVVARIAEWDARRAAADAELRRIDARIQARSPDERIATPEESPRKPTPDGHSVGVCTPTPIPRSPDETPPGPMTECSPQLPLDPNTMTLATPADLPPAAYVADLVFTLDAERVTPSEFSTIDAFAPAHVLLGDPSPALTTSPYRNGVPAAFRSDFFADRWALAKRPAWSFEGGRIVCRLDDSFRGDDATLVREPLIDRPEIELRFAPGDEGSLVEVAFAPSMTAAECRAWLAAEWGEARPVARGPAEWAVGESIRAVWADADGAAGEWVESVPGVRELVVGGEAEAPTAELRFDPAQGWTRESAEAWVGEMVAKAMSPAVVVPPVPVPASVGELVTAG